MLKRMIDLMDTIDKKVKGVDETAELKQMLGDMETFVCGKRKE